MAEKKWDNEDRNRYYGLRKGDIVNALGLHLEVCYGRAEVVEYGQMDNNRVVLRTTDGILVPWVAEWCRIIQKVEDKTKPSRHESIDYDTDARGMCFSDADSGL